MDKSGVFWGGVYRRTLARRLPPEGGTTNGTQTVELDRGEKLFHRTGQAAEVGRRNCHRVPFGRNAAGVAEIVGQTDGHEGVE